MKKIYSVVGVTFDNRQEILSNFYKDYHHGGDYNCSLMKEDNNPYDKNAISVILNVNGKDESIGYIAKKENVELRNVFDKIKSSKIKSIGPNKNGDLGVSITVDIEEELKKS